MAITQMQLIQSLGEAMSWFEREMSWGIPPTELRHLCGRIGELYAAVITNGQMALKVNQRGYDVVSSGGERISVKTTAMMGTGGHVSFSANSLELVDRVIVLRVNTEEMQVETILDVPVSEAINLMSLDGGGKRILSIGRLVKKSIARSDIKTVNEVSYQGYIVRELETGSIEVEHNGVLLLPAKPALRELAMRLNIELLNGNGNHHTTRQLGNLIIRSVQVLKETEAHPGVSADNSVSGESVA
ncbi:MAG: hypothetical protein ABI865_14485 [Nitrosospira sp.]